MFAYVNFIGHRYWDKDKAALFNVADLKQTL